MQASIYIGFEPREAAAFAVTKNSVKRRLNLPFPVHGIVLEEMRRQGLFWRPQERHGGQLWDVISEAPCATEFSISRFLTPHIARERVAYPAAPAWALFMDSDMLALTNVGRVFEELHDDFAVMCVKHLHEPPSGFKMDHQIQTAYARKNWSSFAAYNLRHPANKGLTVEMINSIPGRDLHRFCWLEDSQIGDLHPTWNWLSTFGTPTDGTPRVVHFTEGTPDMPGYEDVPFADAWRQELACWAM